MYTIHQRRAEQAFQLVTAQLTQNTRADYKRFAKNLPSLIHGCGLAQAVAFGQAKAVPTTNQGQAIGAMLSDLARLVRGTDLNALASHARGAELLDYLKLSRDALACAEWLKRYAEALIEGD